MKRNVPGGAVAVFGEVKAGLSGELLPLVLVLGVVVGTVKLAYHVRVLLNGTGLAQVGHTGDAHAISRARLRSTVKLGQDDDRNL